MFIPVVNCDGHYYESNNKEGLLTPPGCCGISLLLRCDILQFHNSPPDGTTYPKDFLHFLFQVEHQTGSSSAITIKKKWRSLRERMPNSPDPTYQLAHARPQGESTQGVVHILLLLLLLLFQCKLLRYFYNSNKDNYHFH